MKFNKHKSASPLKKKIPYIQDAINEEQELNSFSKKEFFSEYNNKKLVKNDLEHSKKVYFCSDNRLEDFGINENILFSQIEEKEIIFNIKIFLEFLAYQLIFFLFLGPFLSGFLYLINKRNSSLSRNQHFWGFNLMFFLQTFQYLITVTSFILYYHYRPKSIYLIEIYLLFVQVLIYLCIKSINYATMNSQKIEFLKKKKISSNDYSSEFSARSCYDLTRFEIEKELQATLLRNEIDIGLFGFRFITPVLEKYNDMLRDEAELTDKKILVLKTTRIGRQAEKLKKSVKTSYKGKEVFSGFHLAMLLLEQTDKNKFTKLYIHFISMCFSITSATIPKLVRINYNGTCMGENDVENYMITSLFVGTFVFIYFNMLSLINCIFEYDQIFRYLSQLSNLLSPRKLNYYYSKKYLPTINFFEPITLKSWGVLHKVLRNYGKKQKTRVDHQLSIFLLFAIFFFVFLILTVFNYLGTYSEINLVVLIYQTMFIFVVVLFVLKKGKAINKLYSFHIMILKRNKNILSDLLRLNEIYFNDKFIPENVIYCQGVSSLKDLCNILIENNLDMKENNFSKLDRKIALIKNILKDLIYISDGITEELQHYSKNEPFSVFSFPATEEFVNSIWALIASAILAILKKFLFE